MAYLVSKTSRACAANVYCTTLPLNFEEITLTKNHTFQKIHICWDPRFSNDDYKSIIKILFPRSIMLSSHPEVLELERFIRKNVKVFYREGWYLCVPSDEVLEK